MNSEEIRAQLRYKADRGEVETAKSAAANAQTSVRGLERKINTALNDLEIMVTERLENLEARVKALEPSTWKNQQ